MGQRLNIEIVYGDKTLANAYYHWSAFTSSALDATEHILEAYRTATSVRLLNLAVELLEATGAGVNNDERTRINEDRTGVYDGMVFNDAIDRNKGLLAVTDQGIEETRRWEEGRVTIDLSSETIAFDVLWQWSLEEYKEEYDDADHLPRADYDLTCIPFSDIDAFKAFKDEHPDGYITSDGMVIGWIE